MGVAFDKAGTHGANADSLQAAIQLAIQLTTSRQ